MVQGLDTVELSTVLKDDARFFTILVEKQDAKTLEELELPEGSRAICYYRKGIFDFANSETELQQDDEVIILTRGKNLEELRERWRPKQTEDHSSEKEK